MASTTKKRKRVLCILITSLLSYLVSCGTIPSTQLGYWVKPGATKNGINTANQFCVDGAAERRASYVYAADFFYSAPVDQIVYQLCMRRLGHTLIRIGDEDAEISSRSSRQHTKRNMLTQPLPLNRDNSQKTQSFDITTTVPGVSFQGGPREIASLPKRNQGVTRNSPLETLNRNQRFPWFYRYWFLHKASHIRLEEVLPFPTILGIVDIKTIKEQSLTAKANESLLASLYSKIELQMNDFLENLRKQEKQIATIKRGSPERVALQHKFDTGLQDYLVEEYQIEQELIETRKETDANLLHQTIEATRRIAEQQHVDIVIKKFGENLPRKAFLPPSIATLLKHEPRDLTIEVLNELDKDYVE